MVFSGSVVGQSVTELIEVLLHEVFTLEDVVLGGEVLHAVLLVGTVPGLLEGQHVRGLVMHGKDVERWWAVLLPGSGRPLGRGVVVLQARVVVRQGAPGVLQDAQVRVHVRQLLQLAVGAAVGARGVRAHLHELVLLVHQELVGVLWGAHASRRPIPLHVEGPEGPA